MKKMIGILMAFAMCFLAVGCGNIGAILSNDGPVEDYAITVPFVEEGESVDINGSYTGQLVEGKPEGEGSFYAEGEDGFVFEYEGNFSNGCFDGYGMTTITDGEDVYRMEGTYTMGEFTPTAGEKVNHVGQLDVFGVFSISSRVADYIDSQPELFPIGDADAIAQAALQDFSSKQFKKSGEQQDLGLVRMKGLYTVQVFEQDYLGGKLTSILAMDDDGEFYVLHYLDAVEVYEGDTFDVYALPCGTSSFDNISGGVTNVIVMAASYFS